MFSVVDKEKVEQRLMKLEQAVRKLREIAAQPWEEYAASEALRDRGERNLQVAAQACIDIANHIIADKGYRTPQGYADSFVVLQEEGIIPIELADKIMVCYRMSIPLTRHHHRSLKVGIVKRGGFQIEVSMGGALFYRQKANLV